MGHRSGLSASALVLGLFLLNGTALAGAEQSTAEEQSQPVSVSPAKLMERFGMKVEALRLSAAGHMLDLRYRITDVEKADALMARWKPFLVDENTGRKLSTPSFAKVGALRQSPEQVEEGRTYFVLFANPGRQLGHGDTVTLALDRVRVEELRHDHLGGSNVTKVLHELNCGCKEGPLTKQSN